MEALAPFVPLAESSAASHRASPRGPVARVPPSSAAASPITTRALLGIAVLVGILSGHTEEPVNLVNSPSLSEERGIELSESRDSGAEDFTDLVTVRIDAAEEEVEVSGTPAGPRHEPTSSRSGARASICPSPTTSRSSATPTSPG